MQLTVSFLQVSPLYIALLTLLLLALSVNVVKQRMKHKIVFGDGGNDSLQQAQRVQGNFIEYTPLAMLALVALEATGVPAWAVHAAGATFFISRVMHAIGLSSNKGQSANRYWSMVITFLWLLIVPVTILIRVVLA